MSQLGRNRAGAPARFRLDRTGGKVFGVCAGLANKFGMDPLIVRLVFVAGTILGFGTFALVYIGIALLAD
jgi:phage shock protein C